MQVFVLLVAIVAITATIVLNTLVASNRFMNTSSVGFTPSGGSLTTLDGVQGASYDEGISTKKEGADFDLFPTVAVTDYRDPKITLDSINVFALFSVAAGVRGVLTVTVRDAKNGAAVGGGAMIVTMANAGIEGRNFNANYREFGKQQIVFGALSTDGATHPVSIAAA